MNKEHMPQKGTLWLIETRNDVFWTTRKLDAQYFHVRFRYGQATYREVDARRYRPMRGSVNKPLIALSKVDGVIEEYPR